MGRRWRQAGSALAALVAWGAVGAGGGGNDATAQPTPDGEVLLNEKCAACHERLPDGGMSRISAERKTPEGWDMTLVRMMLVHGVELAPDERRALVKHLADTQGLAPAETRDYRYALERRPNVVEDIPSDELATMCARCHSYARVALQRRTEDEWLKLSHFHLGQYPTTEYQALGRDRKWWEIASTELPEQLADLFPLETEAWAAWRQREDPDLSGTWRTAGHHPGRGGFEGTATVTKAGDGDDTYDVEVEVRYPGRGGGTLTATGSAVLYTGYEWRASFDIDGETYLEVYTVADDGNSASGRWFQQEVDSIGGDLHAVRVRPDHAEIMAVHPSHLRSGETAEVAVHGVNLEGEVDLGPGVEVVRTVSESPETIVVEARAEEGAETGVREVAVGGTAAADDLFTVYRRVDSVRVEPEYAIARVGGDGPLPAIPAQFEAIGYANGPDGTPGTDDDVRIGVLDAEWSVENYNEVAEAMRDTEFAGEMRDDGLFMPAAAGPNPERVFSTNNAGDLLVKATVGDDGRTVEGTAHLVVTVQRWNDPPIR